MIIGLMAALCYRYHLTPREYAVQEILVASHGATLRKMHHGDIVVEYIPEPMVGEAAASFIQLEYRGSKDSYEDLSVLLRLVSGSEMARLFSKGELGEFASIVYLLHIFEMAKIKQSTESQRTSTLFLHSNAIQVGEWTAITMETTMATLVSFLEAVFQKRTKCFEHATNTFRLLNGLMAFTGWYRSEIDINVELIETGWLHKIAFIAIVNQKSFDNFIPLLLPDLIPRDHVAKESIDMLPIKKDSALSIQSEGTRQSQPSKRGIGDILSDPKEVAESSSAKRPNTMKLKQTKHFAELFSSASLESFNPMKNNEHSTSLNGEFSVKRGRKDVVFSSGSVMVNQVKNYDDDIYLSEGLKYCTDQCKHVFNRINEGLVSVLVMTGKGRVILKKAGNTVETYSSMLILLDDYPNHLFIIINDFAGVDPIVRDYLKQLSQVTIAATVIDEPFKEVAMHNTTSQSRNITPEERYLYHNAVATNQQLSSSTETIDDDIDTTPTEFLGDGQAFYQNSDLSAKEFSCGKKYQFKGIIIYPNRKVPVK